jgi:hypothetical protein
MSTTSTMGQVGNLKKQVINPVEDAPWRPHPRKHPEREVGRTPWSAADANVGLLAKFVKPRKGGSGGTRADGGVRPTCRESFSLLLLCGAEWERSCVLHRHSCRRPPDAETSLGAARRSACATGVRIAFGEPQVQIFLRSGASRLAKSPKGHP